MIAIDHIFICSDNKGSEADELLDFGLDESAGRRHIGQGTTNRKFLFQNFFLEILWAVNESELNSSNVRTTMLHRRMNFKHNGYSPFGLCLVNTPETDKLFRHSDKYQPDYFEKGKVIDFIPNTKNPSLPWLFRLPFRQESAEINERVENKLKLLSKATFDIAVVDYNHPIVTQLSHCSQIEFQDSKESQLTLEFDNGNINHHQFEALPLTIVY